MFMEMWSELLEKIREEIVDLQLVDKAILDSYNQFAFKLEVTADSEVDPGLTFSKDTAIPQEVSLILCLCIDVTTSICLKTDVFVQGFINIPIWRCILI